MCFELGSSFPCCSPSEERGRPSPGGHFTLDPGLSTWARQVVVVVISVNYYCRLTTEHHRRMKSFFLWPRITKLRPRLWTRPVSTKRAMSGKGKVLAETLANPVKAKSDGKDYRVVQLHNGLRALLISDTRYSLEKLNQEELEESTLHIAPDQDEVDDNEDMYEGERFRSLGCHARTYKTLKNKQL